MRKNKKKILKYSKNIFWKEQRDDPYSKWKTLYRKIIYLTKLAMVIYYNQEGNFWQNVFDLIKRNQIDT